MHFTIQLCIEEEAARYLERATEVIMEKYNNELPDLNNDGLNAIYKSYLVPMNQWNPRLICIIHADDKENKEQLSRFDV